MEPSFSSGLHDFLLTTLAEVCYNVRVSIPVERAKRSLSRCIVNIALTASNVMFSPIFQARLENVEGFYC